MTKLISASTIAFIFYLLGVISSNSFDFKDGKLTLVDNSIKVENCVTVKNSNNLPFKVVAMSGDSVAIINIKHDGYIMELNKLIKLPNCNTFNIVIKPKSKDAYL